MRDSHTVATATGRSTMATPSRWVQAVLVMAVLGLPTSGKAATVTWNFSGMTVAQTPYCSGIDLPCPSSATYAFTGSVAFDPTTNEVFGMSVDVDYLSGLHYSAGAGSFSIVPWPLGDGATLRMQAGSSVLTVASLGAGFSGALSSPPSCMPLAEAAAPFTSTCLVSVSVDGALRNIYGNVLSIQQVPEPAVGLTVLTGIAVALRRFRRRAIRR